MIHNKAGNRNQPCFISKYPFRFVDKSMSEPLLLLLIVLVCIGLTACITTRQAALPNNFPSFYKEGHRGARGLMPENTIPSMIKAIEEGANVIEVDIYSTKDGQMLVAHDPYVNTAYTRLPNGAEIAPDEARKYIWHQMPYEEIRRLDVGSKPFSAFPQQVKMVTYMPLLGELIDSVEAYTAARNLPQVIYNIELKTSRRFDSLGYNTPPAQLVKAVMDVVITKNIGNRFYIQSFDVRTVQEVRRQYPEVVVALLTDSKNTFEQNISEIGFLPPIYSPYYKLVDAELVRKCHQQKIKIIPWTVNTTEEMQQLIDLGVDGIITDYPNYLQAVAPASTASGRKK